MKFGILLTSVYDASVDARVQRRQHEELVRTAEELGFDLMVCGQHFLGSELRYFQPVPWLTHMAQVAPSMQVATGIILLSMVNPVDIAEQMATLDVLTDGRATFGVGLGYSGHEFDAFGVEPGTRVARFEESLELVKALWSGEKVDFAGRFHSVHGAQPSVRPLQEGGLPVWIGGQAAGAVKRAARMGDAWYAPPFPSHAELAQLRKLFLDTRDEHGCPPAGTSRCAASCSSPRPGRRAWRRHWTATAPATRRTRSGACRGRTPRSATERSCGRTSRSSSSSGPRRTAPPSWPGCATSSA
ncbi:LLM class flavin-dependent oxidoreductase [Blastococcus sp. PRF04-17]|uniref:LLM class flavin-dependent oxidoreductase n=1 Tax=Blastococcus sp. PRF04-17 TaxID=2933797 RepID=UPI001FF648AE|nr:LLM class flavin-dependent oxidoreductase [Blastococcus sp. PRF04-17]UOY01813.1 LLM class flavin-dependent oxidoreductase [Blastococcus sp. PRF04-17]